MLKIFKGSTEFTSDFSRGLDAAVVLSFSSGAAWIEIRSPKPLTQLFFDVAGSHNGTALAVSTWTGAAFESVTDSVDDTKVLTRSGYVSWRNPTTIAKDGERYRYRFDTGQTDTQNLTFRFLGMVFCQEFDLKSQAASIARFKPAGDTNLTRFLVAAKDDIVQNLRNRGKKIWGTEPRDLTEFDFLEPGQVRTAAAYLALSKIFFEISDEPNDKWIEKSKDFAAKYGDAIQVFWLSLDLDGDGEKDDDSTESMAIQSGVMVRS